MNLRQFSIAILISALPLLSSADSPVSLNEGDFKAAEKITRDGKTVLSVKLSKSGKAKLKKLNNSDLNEEVRTELAGVLAKFKLRAPVTGDGLELGPYPEEDVLKITSKINGQ